MMTESPRPRLILADDHQMLVEGMRAMLSKRFDVAGVAHGGEELLALLERTPADCLLLDLAMPGKSGLELLPDVRAARPGIRVLIVTMHLDRILADAALHAGASGFVPKDSGIDELSEAIGEVLAGRSYISPRVPPQAGGPAAGSAAHAGLATLTPRQLDIVRLIGQGKSSAEIGGLLGLSHYTITFHRARIRKVLGIANEWGLARFAILVQLGDPAPAELARRTGVAAAESAF